MLITSVLAITIKEEEEEKKAIHRRTLGMLAMTEYETRTQGSALPTLRHLLSCPLSAETRHSFTGSESQLKK